jgi:RNA polymerase sigma-70 factor (ECF subfamily)
LQDASRDAALIDELYHANYAAVLRVCSRILRNPDDAADAAQQVFLIALESLDLTTNGSAARAWLLTVARNHCLDLLRRRKRLGKALITLGSDASRAPDVETAVADRDFVGLVFKHLSNRERQALWHSAVESRPLADIAGRLRVSYMAAAQVLHRARRHAVQVAARVAVVVGIFQLGRQRTGGGFALAGTRLAAVAAVSVMAVCVQISSPTRQPVPDAASLAVPSRSAGVQGAGSAVKLPATQALPSASLGTLPSPLAGVGQGGGSATTLNSGINQVRQLLGPLPSAVPLPTSLPALR